MITAPDDAVLDQPAGDVFGRIDGDGKAHPCAGRITAVFTPMTSPRELTSGPPELPGFNAASVWMMLSISRPELDAERPAQRADHARRHGVLEAVRIADGDGQLADPQPIGITEPHRLEVRRINPENRQVRVRVCADEMRVRVPAIGQRDFNPVRAMNDVAVGQDEPVRRDDKSGAAATRLLPRASCPGFSHVNLHHRRADRFRGGNNSIGIRVQ